jgi:3-dehydroquinate dehydratase-2
MKQKILIINGPNLNLLGKREVHIYGKTTLKDIQKITTDLCKKEFALELTWLQLNSEEKILNKLHSLVLTKKQPYHYLIINPAGFSHTSVVILDALLALKIPIAEVHLTNPHNRESFRGQMLTAKAASLIMGGLGELVYYFAIKALMAKFSGKQN